MSFTISHQQSNEDYDYNEPRDIVKSEYISTSDWGWAIDPEGHVIH